MNTVEIIAEIGQNHNGDLGLAFELIQEAKKNGADVAKFQVYDAINLFPKENNPWYDYNCKTELSQEDVAALFKECERVGIEFMASVFDIERLAWLELLGVKRYKIASRSILDTELLTHIGKTNKEIIVSLGWWKESTFPIIPTNAKLDFLYCVSEYPVALNDLHLSKIDFTRYSGFSDHSIGLHASYIALSRGARMLERHFTLDKTMYGPDHLLSITPSELSQLNQFRNDLIDCL